MKRLLLLLVLSGLLAAGCLQPPADGDVGAGLVVQFGDSLATMSGPDSVELYLADPLWRASFNQTGGTQLDTSAWVDGYPHSGDAVQGGQPGATVVLALGTNDIGCVVEYDASLCGSTDTLASVKGDFRAAVAAATNSGAGRVVAVNVSEESAAVYHGGSRLAITQAWNAWLLQADASTHPDYRLLDVVDWSSETEGHAGDWYAGDQIHHNEAGQAAYAGFLFEVAR